MSPFMKKQLEHLYNLFQSQQVSVNPTSSCSLARKGNYLTTALVSVSTNLDSPWIIDFGAIDHMTGC